MRKGALSFILFLALIAGMGICAPPATLAAYPEKPVTFICVFPAGGAMDMTARALTHLGLWPAHAHSPPAGYPLPFSLQRVVAA